MRNRTVEINVRVNESEKKKMKRNAQNSGLSLSAYLRKCGLKQEIYAIPDKEFYKIYEDIGKIKNKLYSIEKTQIEEELSLIEQNFLRIYNSSKWVIRGGNN